MRFENIDVMSRDKAIRTSHIIDKDTIIISINDKDAPPAELALDNVFIKDVVFLAFDDEECEAEGGMTADDANEILGFIEEHMDEDVDLIVHCGGGISRSAGTVAAIMLLLFGDDSPVFDSNRFSPNMHCYRTILSEAGLGFSEEEGEEASCRKKLWLEKARENGLV